MTTITTSSGSISTVTAWELAKKPITTAIGSDLDYFEWNVINGRIHIYFLNGGRFYGDEWIWDYRIKNGHTVIINGRRFTREKSYYDDWWYDGYYSKKHQPDALAGAKE